MQQALPYRRWLSNSTTTTSGGSISLQSRLGGGDHDHNTSTSSSGDVMITNKNNGTITISVAKLVSENAVIVFARRGCCMCHSLKLLLLGLGVNPTIYDVDEQDEAAIIAELSKIVSSATEGNNNGWLQFPAVFVGGRLFGGLDKVMASHISGELVPILREAGALWL